MPKALIAMSGGVDSSVAAYLTAQKGYSCIGCTMQLQEDSGTVRDAEAVCKALQIPFYNFPFVHEFRKNVIEPFAAAYLRGETPNPCIRCNKTMKFGLLAEEGKKLGCDMLVTGHYARIVEENGSLLLKKALDESKDQSYVLYNLTQEQLAHILFPLGLLTKKEVRELASSLHLPSAKKPESQDICFVPDGNYAGLVEAYAGKACLPGRFIDRSGRTLGRHRGIIHYTIGQRRGLGISSTEPLYVLDIRPETNTVVLGSNADLFQEEASVTEVNWIAGKAPQQEFRAAAKIRYRHREERCRIIVTGPHTVRLVFDTPQRAITRGQSAVFYDGSTVLGGGILR
jgi:tRNA-specific 2-thiouridylase